MSVLTHLDLWTATRRQADRGHSLRHGHHLRQHGGQVATGWGHLLNWVAGQVWVLSLDS